MGNVSVTVNKQWTSLKLINRRIAIIKSKYYEWRATESITDLSNDHALEGAWYCQSSAGHVTNTGAKTNVDFTSARNRGSCWRTSIASITFTNDPAGIWYHSSGRWTSLVGVKFTYDSVGIRVYTSYWCTSMASIKLINDFACIRHCCSRRWIANISTENVIIVAGARY